MGSYTWKVSKWPGAIIQLRTEYKEEDRNGFTEVLFCRGKGKIESKNVNKQAREITQW